MRGTILTITFPQRPQTFGLRGLKLLYDGYLVEAQERKYLVLIFSRGDSRLRYETEL